jgi:hypothetical protein
VHFASNRCFSASCASGAPVGGESNDARAGGTAIITAAHVLPCARVTGLAVLDQLAPRQLAQADKMRRNDCERIFSASPSNSDIARCSQQLRSSERDAQCSPVCKKLGLFGSTSSQILESNLTLGEMNSSG